MSKRELGTQSWGAPLFITRGGGVVRKCIIESQSIVLNPGVSHYSSCLRLNDWRAVENVSSPGSPRSALAENQLLVDVENGTNPKTYAK